MSAQTPKPQFDPAQHVAAHIDKVRDFAVQAVKDPSLIEKTAKANRAKVLNGTGKEAFMGDTAPANLIAEDLYQIQEDLGLDSAIAAARLLAHLPTLPKEVQK